jgi:broad specificity phosphatase PhoE
MQAHPSGGDIMDTAESTLVLVRHAHRDTSHKDLDNGLTSRGKKEAQFLAQVLPQQYDLRNSLFLSSPKQRCIETILPLAKTAKQEVQIESLLDEQSHHETSGDLHRRIEKFLKQWKKREFKQNPQIIVACSHGDWLPLAVEFLTGAQSDFDKGGWIGIDINEGQTYFRFRSMIGNKG